MVNIPVRTSFCGWLVLRRQRIGIGYPHRGFISLLLLGIASIASRTHQSQKNKVCSRIDRSGYEKVQFHVDAPSTQFGSECTSQRVPEVVNWYALEDGDEDAGDGKADDKVVAPEEDTSELDNGEDAVLEKDAAVPLFSDT